MSTGLENRYTSFLERPGEFWSAGCGYNISIPPSWSVVECSGREWQMEWQTAQNGLFPPGCGESPGAWFLSILTRPRAS